MKKTGIIVIALAGLSAPFLLKTGNSESARTEKSRSVQHLRGSILQQIPGPGSKSARQGNSDSSAPDAKAGGAFEGFSSEEILAKLVGKWEQTKSTSKQILTIEENGTATMLVEPQGLWTSVLGKQITIDIEWSLENATLTLKAVGGKPANKLDYIKQLWGSEFVREINSIEDKMFTLRDDNGDVSQKWIRTAY